MCFSKPSSCYLDLSWSAQVALERFVTGTIPISDLHYLGLEPRTFNVGGARAPGLVNNTRGFFPNLRPLHYLYDMGLSDFQTPETVLFLLLW